MLRKLREMGLEGRLYKIIEAIYSDTRNKIIMSKGTTESFPSNCGVRQGCPLSPVLFCLFLEDGDEALKRRQCGGTVLMGEKITNLKFADDVVLVVENPEELSTTLWATEEYSRKNHFHINGTKTKVMVFRNGGKLAKNETWTLNGTKLEVVNEYKYLDLWFSTRGTFGTHAKKLSNKARLATNRAWGIMKLRINIVWLLSSS